MKYPVHAIVYYATRGKSFEAFFFFKNWGKAPCAFMGAWGRCEPPHFRVFRVFRGFKMKEVVNVS
jgi:hypothetical protein